MDMPVRDRFAQHDVSLKLKKQLHSNIKCAQPVRQWLAEHTLHCLHQVMFIRSAWPSSEK